MILFHSVSQITLISVGFFTPSFAFLTLVTRDPKLPLLLMLAFFFNKEHFLAFHDVIVLAADFNPSCPKKKTFSF